MPLLDRLKTHELLIAFVLLVLAALCASALSFAVWAETPPASGLGPAAGAGGRAG